MGAAAVVYVHGLWMFGAEGLPLRQRLQRDHGYRLHVFRYGSVRSPMASIVDALGAQIASIDAPQVHLLGHSLGGAVILHCLQHYPMAQPGRVVFLGAPVLGSRTARLLAGARAGRCLLGRAASAQLLQPRVQCWDLPRELGIIAGTLPLGFGQLLLKFGEDNDGTVAVSETHLPGAADYATMPVSHMGLLWSAAVAREVGSFLEHGCFGR
ncbi:MAG TPA: alpha/beta fold hydrolase [Steroidobacteraceae bacterium]|jgi:pimeloyl-ACP methyl ester carboxylesterase|nr:alpha/beta fold hydrolase [Steroidobacteraceae bacterium]